MWIFGYGSLVWRPDFPFAERIGAHLTGYARRFWQASPDHRGTPEAPGRVVTLVQQPGEVFGMAYRLHKDDISDVVAHLDHREKAGYRMEHVALALSDGRRVQASVYRATTDNPEFLGPDSIEAMAHHIANSRGPSGPNIEYLLRLDHALRELSEPDLHVTALVNALPIGSGI